MGIKIPVIGDVAGILGIDLKAQVALRDAVRTALAGWMIGADVEHLATTGKIDPFYFLKDLEQPIIGLLQQSSSFLGRDFFRVLLLSSMGLDPQELQGEAAQAVNTIERAIGFGIDVHLGTGAMQGGLKLLLGHAAPDGLFEALRILPESVGLNFFLGQVLATIFDRATGTPMAEAINLKVHPNRLEWPQIGRLLRQHDLTKAEADNLLLRAGFRPQDIEKLARLERSLLTLGDLQGLYEFGKINEGQLRNHLDTLGYVLEDADNIVYLYGNKAQTEGGRTYAAVARGEFVKGHIAESEYRTILELVNTPQLSINWLVQGAIMESSHGKTSLARADIKKLRQEGLISNQMAVQRLVQAGATEDDATLLLAEWDKEQSAGRTGLGTTRILSYLNSGVIDTITAYNKLVADGMRPEDANFLTQHPGAHTHTKQYPLTPAIIESAYLDDILTFDEAKTQMIALDVDPVAVDLRLRTLSDRKARGNKPKQAHKTLSEAQILDAFKFGLATDAWAIRELETAGYSDADATLIVTVEQVKLDPTHTVPSGWTQLS